MSDRQIKHEVTFLRVVKGAPSWTRNPLPPMCIRCNTANYLAGMPSSFGKQAACREERGAEERRRAEVAARGGKREKDLANPLFD